MNYWKHLGNMGMYQCSDDYSQSLIRSGEMITVSGDIIVEKDINCQHYLVSELYGKHKIQITEYFAPYQQYLEMKPDIISLKFKIQKIFMKRLSLVLITLLFPAIFYGQIKADSSVSAHQDSVYSSSIYKPNYKKLIVPAVFIGYGVVSLTSGALKDLNRSTKYEIGEHQPSKIKLDNYTQYLPAVMVYGYNLAGIKGKHNFKERTIIYGTSQLLSAAFVMPLKYLVKEERPDGSNSLSFPSGHTATAFSSAQFLFREYKDENFWLAISGYPIAIFTGVYRMLNDKHWLGDIIGGAGFGILSTEIAYWLFPTINKMLNKKDSKSIAFIYPVLQPKNSGVGLVFNF